MSHSLVSLHHVFGTAWKEAFKLSDSRKKLLIILSDVNMSTLFATTFVASYTYLVTQQFPDLLTGCLLLNLWGNLSVLNFIFLFFSSGFGPLFSCQHLCSSCRRFSSCAMWRGGEKSLVWTAQELYKCIRFLNVMIRTETFKKVNFGLCGWTCICLINKAKWKLAAWPISYCWSEGPDWRFEKHFNYPGYKEPDD